MGTGYPIYDELRKHVVDPGKASQGGQFVGSVLYSRGMYAAAVIAEAIRKAQELAGTPKITAVQLRDGFEALDITPARLAEMGLPGFGPEIRMSCADHGGSGMVRLQQWDAGAGKWTLITDFAAPDHEVLDPLIAEDSEAYAAEAGLSPRC
jgi:branched-chain amino acid transport system substrate-binding protein